MPRPLNLSAACLLLALLLSAPTPAKAAFDLNFSTNGTLPTAQGLTYFSNVPEGTTYSIVGGALHLDTQHYGSDVYSWYREVDGFHANMNSELIVTTKTASMTSFFGTDFGFYDGTASMSFSVRPTGWSTQDGKTGTFADSSVFHTFDLKSFGATDTYTLSIDGVQVASGTRGGGTTGTHEVFFGDGSPTGGNMIADIKSISFTEGDPNAIASPAPSGLTLAATACLTGVAISRFRRWSGVKTGSDSALPA